LTRGKTPQPRRACQVGDPAVAKVSSRRRAACEPRFIRRFALARLVHNASVMIRAAVVLTWLTFLVSACSSVSDGVAAPSIPGPAPWQGPTADRLNRENLAPSTPALKGLKGRTPLVYLTRSPEHGTAAEPSYELAVFDDGTLVYEGHRCVRIGGLILTRLSPDDLVAVRDLLAALCVGLDRLSDGELCEDAVTLRLTCANGGHALAGTDHCRKDDPQGRRIEALRAGLLEALELEAWLGGPTTRQACSAGALDLAPHELARTLALDAS
jgi:hypothetical protein